MKQRETRVLSREMRIKRNDAGQPVMEGYAAVFNSLSQDLGGFKEKIALGAFAAELASEPDVRALFNHDESLILGRTKSKTLTLNEDETGLFWSCVLPGTTVARDLAESVERGDVDQCSFGFICLEDEWELMADGTPLRTVKTAALFDVSAVTYPAYEATTVGLRSVGQELTEDVKRAIEKLQNCDNGAETTTHNEYCHCVDLCAPRLRMRLVAASL